jgi:hypothetical protein
LIRIRLFTPSILMGLSKLWKARQATWR